MTPEEFQRRIKQDLNKLKQDASGAIKRTARRAITPVADRAPKAFGDLAKSVIATDNSTVVSAPHAQAVEVGARPHLVPLEELVKWVKLRGLQFVENNKNEHSERVGRQLQSMERSGHLDTEAPRQIAEAIQQSILRNGIKPTWFVQSSLDDVMSILDEEMRKVFK